MRLFHRTPCVFSHASNSEKTDITPPHLSYLAYNPNAHFKRTSPGFPDFGIVIMLYHSNGSTGPTFNTISSLVSLCQSFDNHLRNTNERDFAGFPLHKMSISNAGSVDVFGVTDGDVPTINN